MISPVETLGLKPVPFVCKQLSEFRSRFQNGTIFRMRPAPQLGMASDKTWFVHQAPICEWKVDMILKGALLVSRYPVAHHAERAHYLSWDGYLGCLCIGHGKTLRDELTGNVFTAEQVRPLPEDAVKRGDVWWVPI